MPSNWKLGLDRTLRSKKKIRTKTAADNKMKIVNVADRSLLSRFTIVVDASQKRTEDKKRNTEQIRISGLKFKIRFPTNPFGSVFVIRASVLFPLKKTIFSYDQSRSRSCYLFVRI